MSTSMFWTYSVSLYICHHCCTSTIVLLFHCSHFVYNLELILAVKLQFNLENERWKISGVEIWIEWIYV